MFWVCFFFVVFLLFLFLYKPYNPRGRSGLGPPRLSGLQFFFYSAACQNEVKNIWRCFCDNLKTKMLFFLLATKKRRLEQRRSAGPIISLPDSSVGKRCPGLDPSVSCVFWEADANLKPFSHVYYFLICVSISFVSDCTKCLCWLL